MKTILLIMSVVISSAVMANPFGYFEGHFIVENVDCNSSKQDTSFRKQLEALYITKEDGKYSLNEVSGKISPYSGKKSTFNFELESMNYINDGVITTKKELSGKLGDATLTVESSKYNFVRVIKFYLSNGVTYYRHYLRKMMKRKDGTTYETYMDCVHRLR
jgi:hypothetical protein